MHGDPDGAVVDLQAPLRQFRDQPADFGKSGQSFQHVADNGCDRIPVAWLLLRVIDFGYFAAGQERRHFSFPHAVAFERYAVCVLNNTVQNRIS